MRTSAYKRHEIARNCRHDEKHASVRTDWVGGGARPGTAVPSGGIVSGRSAPSLFSMLPQLSMGNEYF